MPPYIDNIVKPRPSLEISTNNYLNANYIYDPHCESTNPTFILTQGPMEHTVEAFWNTVYNHRVPLIICLVEQTSIPTKCFNYWDKDVIANIKDLAIESSPLSNDENMNLTSLKIQPKD